MKSKKNEEELLLILGSLFSITFGFIAIIFGSFFIYQKLTSIPTLSEERVNVLIKQCDKNKQSHLFVFKKHGDKKSGVLDIYCVEKNKGSDLSRENSDDTTLNSKGGISLSGVPRNVF